MFGARFLILTAVTAALPLSGQDLFQRTIRPVVARYCLTCHSAAKHAGDVNFERFATLAQVVADPKPWQKAVDQISLGEMPPKAMPQPTAAERDALLQSIREALGAAAKARAGDPGPVVLRRLNNAEYTYTIRDLTGLGALEPAKEFPADSAAGEGFMNTGNALVMSPSLVTKYMDAAKGIASHAVLTPTGIRFSRYTTRRDWTDEILTDIRALYAQFTEAGGAETVTQQGIALDKNRGGALPLRKYLTASLGLRGNATPAAIERLAKQQQLSTKYLGLLVRLMQDTRPSPLLDDLRKRWRTATPADVDGIARTIEQWQQTVWKFSSVGHIGKVDGPKAWMEPVNPIVEKQEFRVKVAPTAGANEVTLYLAAHSAGDGTTGDTVTWQEPKLVIPGRPAILLKDLRATVAELTSRRERLLNSTAKALAAAAEPSGNVRELARRHGVDPEDLKAWFGYLGVGATGNFKLDLLTSKIEKTGAFDFVKGWGTSKTPMLLTNSSDESVRIPGNMKPHSVAVHPSPTLNIAAGWLSPIAGTVRISATVARSHPECGNGIEYSLELRRGSTRQPLAKGDARSAAPVALGPFEGLRVQPGDLVSVIVSAREGNHSCDLTAIDLRLESASGKWSLSGDVANNVLAGNPHGVWQFYSEPLDAAQRDSLLPTGSLLSRWQSAAADERPRLAAELQRVLTGPGPDGDAKAPDTVLYRQLTSLAGPLFANVTATPSTKAAGSGWGLDPSVFAAGTADLPVKAPSATEVRLPVDLVATAEFVTTGRLSGAGGGEGSVQLEVATAKPQPAVTLKPAGTAVVDLKGTWSSNNQAVAYAMPVVVNTGSAAHRRMEAAFEEFRQMFPAALCYTKIVPVDEVVTLTLYHREDDALSRLILNDKQKAKLDRLWDELHFVSNDAITLVDAFEQLWQYATQDADPSKFEPLRKPIMARAAAFRQRLVETEPRHVQAVLDFADRAYRRPLTEREKNQVGSLYVRLRNEGLPHEQAVRLMLARVLVAPAFLYRAETAPAGKSTAPVSGSELSNRLSYFLWSSMPDAELRQAATAGKLGTPAALQSQAQRMLKDDRVRRLATEFGTAWLHLHDFESLDEKSERHFPTFRDLRQPMFEESVRFFTDFFTNNRSVLSLLDADHTFLNEALAKHYGIPNVEGAEWRRVDNIRQYGRGGILGQGAVLARQSGASRTSPILRGAWILEVLLGEKPPRPPKDVPQLPTDEAAETLTVRELTQRHSTDKRCSVCHVRIDPFGFTLERYDAIGRFRDRDLGNRPIDDKSTLRGVAVEGLPGLRSYLLNQGRSAFVRQFSRKLLGYSLGRGVQLSDQPLLDEIETKLQQSGYHVGTAIDLIVASRQFREIRGRDYEQDHE